MDRRQHVTNEVLLTYRLPEERRRELKQWAAAHSVTMQQMVEEGLDLYVKFQDRVISIQANDAKKDVSPGAKEEYNLRNVEHRVWLALAVEILNAGTPSTQTFIEVVYALAASAAAEDSPPPGGIHAGPAAEIPDSVSGSSGEFSSNVERTRANIGGYRERLDDLRRRLGDIRERSERPEATKRKKANTRT